MSQLKEQLDVFTTRQQALEKKAMALQMEAGNLDKEFKDWVNTELGFASIEGNVHLSRILSALLEKSANESKIII